MSNFKSSKRELLFAGKKMTVEKFVERYTGINIIGIKNSTKKINGNFIMLARH